jgi:hypothetical protein
MGTDGRTDEWMDGQTDMKKLIVAYRDFAYAQEIVKLGMPVMTQGTLQFL